MCVFFTLKKKLASGTATPNCQLRQVLVIWSCRHFPNGTTARDRLLLCLCLPSLITRNGFRPLRNSWGILWCLLVISLSFHCKSQIWCCMQYRLFLSSSCVMLDTMLFALSSCLPPPDGINVYTAVCQLYCLYITQTALRLL